MHSTSPWHIIGASVTGTSHLKRGTGCDDMNLYRQHSNGSLMLAVADGAGSAKYAAVGSSTAATAAVNAIERILDQQDALTSSDKWTCALKKVLQDTRAALEELPLKLQKLQAKVAQSPKNEVENVYNSYLTNMDSTWVAADATEEEVSELSASTVEAPSLNDFATTLLIAIITSEWIVAAQIGDGAIVAQCGEQTFEVLTHPNHGEYLNETSFVTDSDYLQYAQFRVIQHLPTVKGIALLTDGLENLALDFATKTAYPPFFLPLFRFVTRAESTQEELETFLSSERVCRQTDDDKTILLAVRT
jgi:serine/threonine protein phosphatase PrpC